MRKSFAAELMRMMSPAFAQRYPVLTIPLDVKLAFERLRLADLGRQQACSVPHTFEPPGRNAGVPARVLRVAMTEPVLDKAEVLPLVGQRIPAGVTEHVRVDISETRPSAGGGDHVIDRPANHLTATLGDEQPRELVLSGRQVRFKARNSSPASGCSVSSEPVALTITRLAPRLSKARSLSLRVLLFRHGSRLLMRASGQTKRCHSALGSLSRGTPALVFPRLAPTRCKSAP